MKNSKQILILGLIGAASFVFGQKFNFVRHYMVGQSSTYSARKDAIQGKNNVIMTWKIKKQIVKVYPDGSADEKISLFDGEMTINGRKREMPMRSKPSVVKVDKYGVPKGKLMNTSGDYTGVIINSIPGDISIGDSKSFRKDNLMDRNVSGSVTLQSIKDSIAKFRFHETSEIEPKGGKKSAETPTHLSGTMEFDTRTKELVSYQGYSESFAKINHDYVSFIEIKKI